MDTLGKSWDAIQTGVTYAREWLTWAATSIWAAVPGNGVDQKLIVIGSVLGGLAAIPVLHWLWQKWRGTDINTQVGRLDTKVENLTAVVRLYEASRQFLSEGSDAAELPLREAVARKEKEDIVAILDQVVRSDRDDYASLKREHEAVKDAIRKIEMAFQAAEMILSCRCAEPHIYIVKSSLFIHEKGLAEEFMKLVGE